MLPDPYPVSAWTAPCQGSVSLPGSKSLTNRALVLAALSDRRVRLEGALFSRDSHLLCRNLQALGFSVQMSEAGRWIEVQGAGGEIPNASAELFVGNAGTAARFLTALVCLRPGGRYFFDGDEEMYRRPMGGLLECLQGLGAAFTFTRDQGCFPFEVQTNGLRGGRWTVDAEASSQMLSALMMVAPFACSDVRIESGKVRPAFVEMTARLMQQFGAAITGSPTSGYAIQSGRRYTREEPAFAIEPDATAASYFVMLPFVTGGSLLIRGMRESMLQGDVAFADVARSLGVRITPVPDGWQVAAGPPPASGVREFSFESYSDTFLTLAAVAPLFPCSIRITDIGHTRFQETDRIAAMASELARSGARVRQGDDWLLVHPFGREGGPVRDVVINTYKDHRVAMSMALLGSRDLAGGGIPWMRISDPGCCGKTFPGFFAVLENLYQESHDA